MTSSVPRQARIFAWAMLLLSPLAPFVGTPDAFLALIATVAVVALILLEPLRVIRR